MQTPTRRQIGWLPAATLAIVALQAVYATAYIARSSFMVEGERYFCLFDDAMISMRYAANWADGLGWVWNAGERVEGYTNFAWTALMGGAHRLGWSPAHTCLLMQILGALIWLACTPATVALARATRLPPLGAFCAAVLAASQWNLIFFSLNGMETGLLTLLITLGLRGVVLALRRREGRAGPFIWFALAMLVRPDAVLFFAISGVALLAFARRRGHTLGGVLLVVAVVAAHVVWRKSYYGEWFPNTYYLKATNWPLNRRLISGWMTGQWTALALIGPALLGFLNIRRLRRGHALLAVAFAAMFAYGVYIGGDAWPKHYRFVVPATPGLMVWAAWGLIGLLRAPRFTGHRRVVSALIVTGLAVAINGLHLNHWLLRRPPYGTYANQTSVRCALAARRIAEPDAVAAVVWAGAFPYYARLTCVDLLGKCDPYVARLPARREVYRAGHNKFDTPTMLTRHEPDLVVDRPSDLPPTFFIQYQPAKISVDGRDLVLAIRRDSSRIKSRRAGWQPVDWDTANQIYFSARRD
jgi:hypothetical protein